MENLSKLNWLAIGILTVLSMGLAAGWYGLFAEPWMAATGVTEEAAQEGGAGPYIVAIIGTFIQMTALAYLFWSMRITTAATGMKAAALFWLAFFAMDTMVNNMFAMQPFDLTLIDAGNSFVTLLLGGAVLGAWQKGETIEKAAKDIAGEIKN